ncbi:ATP-binding protein [Candidatus Woesebacteria bacterium]|nr:ATP-binding protein [Candidatus Woesebacteria bacterium]
MNKHKPLDRHIDTKLLDHHNNRDLAIILLGPRQIGKTTTLKRLFPNAQYFLLDNEAEKELFERYDISYYKNAIADLGKNVLVLDEIQLLSNPGRAIKILYDQIKGIKIVATGSSTLTIKNKLSESMAGRKLEYQLFPLTFSEILFQKGTTSRLEYKIVENITGQMPASQKAYSFDIHGMLKEVLLFGSYPYLVANPRDTEYLLSIANDAIYKDIIELNLIENKSDAKRLLKLLAYQIGNIVNYSQIAGSLSMDIRTVQRYIEIFEQTYILFRLYPFSLNKKTELRKSPKIYFYDLGIRNAIINNFDDIDVRSDKGAMFENFIINEVLKSNSYNKLNYKMYYWRTKFGSEVDLVLQKLDEIIACEIKFTGGAFSSAFRNRYPHAKTQTITSGNFY